MRFAGNGPNSVPEPTSRTRSRTLVEPDSHPRSPTVMMPSKTLAIPSVMISGLTLNTPIATPLTNPTPTPIPSAMSSASARALPALCRRHVRRQVGGHGDRQVDAAGQHAQRLAGGEDGERAGERRIDRMPAVVRRLSSFHTVTT